MNLANSLKWLMLIAPLSLFIYSGTFVTFVTYVEYAFPKGQLFYVLSKLSALYAFIFLWMQIMQKWQPCFSFGYTHKSLGITVFALILAHVLLFVCATSLRNEQFAYALLLPNLQAYYPSMLSIGLLALCLIGLVLLSVLLRGRIQFANWLHRLAFPAFLLIWIHSYAIGSETRFTVIQVLYFFMLITLVTGLLLRLFNGLNHVE